jgi:hypothetical protein
MSTGNPLKKRKIAVLGSRSVGEFQFQDDEALKNFYLLGKSSLVKQFIEVQPDIFFDEKSS